MKFIDEKKFLLSTGSDYTADTVGIVFKTEEEMGEVCLGLIIPKYMIGYDFKSGDTPKETQVSIDKSKFINDSSIQFGSNNVTIKNYIKVYPLLMQNMTMPKYTIGDKVFVSCIDDDIKTMFFYPYTINRLGQRNQDRVMFVAPATQDKNTELTTDNTYYMLMDSIEQKLVIATSKENKEVCSFKIELDGKNGALTITDEDRFFTIDNTTDTITMKNEAGSSIVLQEDIITIKANTINIEADSDLNVLAERYNVEVSTRTLTADKNEETIENEETSVTSGKYVIRKEVHENSSFAVKGSTAHIDASIIGLNGETIFPKFTIGNISNINVPVVPTNGTTSTPGKMILNTGAGAVPLVKYTSLAPILTAIAAAVDAKVPPTPGAITGTVSGLLATLPTTTVLAT